jgi:Tectonin domain
MRVRSLVAAVVVVLTMLPSFATAQTRSSATDGAIYRWNNGRWVQVDGFGSRIAVGPDGAPWVVNSQNEIYRWNNGGFQKLPGFARDIGVYKWNGNDWDRMEGQGVAISVDRTGNPWVVNASTEIYQSQGGRFVPRSGKARDVGAGDEVWLIGTDNQIYRRGPNDWMPMGGRGERIAAGANGTAWVVNDAGEIFQWRDGEFHLVPGGNAMDVGANAAGQVWIVGRATGGSRGGRRPRFEP